MKGRTIFDAVRTVNDVLDFTEMKECKGIMSAIAFEKAFDSLRLNFLFKFLEILGFDASFISWIKTFYKNITSSVVNSGFFPDLSRLNEVFARVILHRHLFLS